MAHPSQLKTVTNLKHITHPRVALLIAISREFRSPNNPGSYDGGANFLGVLGQTGNTQPMGCGATLTCTWAGQVSDPLRYDAYGYDTPEVLFDFNGSGPHFTNNDPRYFLPYGSNGLVLDSIKFDDEASLLMGWCYLSGGLYAWAYERNWFRNLLLAKARKAVERLNAACKTGQVLLSVRRL